MEIIYMIKRISITVTVMLCFCCSTFGQGVESFGKSKKLYEHSLFLELGGNAAFYSLNYMVRKIKSDSFKITYRMGFGYVPSSDFVLQTATSVPMEVSIESNPYFKGLEFGIGLTYVHFWDEAGTYSQGYIVPRIGYRYDFKSGRLFFRAAFTPLFIVVLHESVKHDERPSFVVPWIGAGFGWTIKK